MLCLEPLASPDRGSSRFVRTLCHLRAIGTPGAGMVMCCPPFRCPHCCAGPSGRLSSAHVDECKRCHGNVPRGHFAFFVTQRQPRPRLTI